MKDLTGLRDGIGGDQCRDFEVLMGVVGLKGRSEEWSMMGLLVLQLC
jgi:hypothetical protein